jgi:hypothetical protein
MRTTEDLIMELEENAKGYAAAALVIGFESTTIFVMANDPNRLQLLNEAVALGGGPVCWYRGDIGRLEMGPLPEYEHKDWVNDYLNALRGGMEAAIDNLDEGR